MSSSPDRHSTPAAPARESGGLLSLEDSRRRSRELRSWSVAARDGMRSIFQNVYDRWRQDWGVSTGIAAGDAEVRVLETSASQVFGDAKARQLLGALMFGESPAACDFSATDHPGAPMARQMGAQAWEAWSRSISQILSRGAEGIPDAELSSLPGEMAPWSGDLTITFPWGEGRWALCLGASAVERILAGHGFQEKTRACPLPEAPARALISLVDALRPKALHVRVELTSVTLSLGQLQTVALGDVIALDHRLDAPAVVLLGSLQAASDSNNAPPTPLCAAWLGQRQGKMAVELHPSA